MTFSRFVEHNAKSDHDEFAWDSDPTGVGEIREAVRDDADDLVWRALAHSREPHMMMEQDPQGPAPAARLARPDLSTLRRSTDLGSRAGTRVQDQAPFAESNPPLFDDLEPLTDGYELSAWPPRSDVGVQQGLVSDRPTTLDAQRLPRDLSKDECAPPAVSSQLAPCPAAPTVASVPEAPPRPWQRKSIFQEAFFVDPGADGNSSRGSFLGVSAGNTTSYINVDGGSSTSTARPHMFDTSSYINVTAGSPQHVQGDSSSYINVTASSPSVLSPKLRFQTKTSQGEN